MYINGGSCDFRQTVERIYLTKVETDETLISYAILDEGQEWCLICDNRLSLHRRNGLEFIFLLSNAAQKDSGDYKVNVEAIGSDLRPLRKTIRLEIGILFFCYKYA